MTKIIQELVMNDNVLVFEQFDNFRVEILKPPCSEVTLIDYTKNAEATIVKLCKGYKGMFDNSESMLADIEDAFSDIPKTKLKGPTEMAYMVWLITGVTRAFCQQLTRTRLASYVMESMRFMGHKGVYQILATGNLSKVTVGNTYDETVIQSIRAYEYMLESGIAPEDARGVLPTNILTSIFVGMPLSTLMHIYDQRMCCQAQQGEWQPLLIQMKDCIRIELGERVAGLLTAPYERGETCGYNATFDRPCVWKKEPTWTELK